MDAAVRRHPAAGGACGVYRARICGGAATVDYGPHSGLDVGGGAVVGRVAAWPPVYWIPLERFRLCAHNAAAARRKRGDLRQDRKSTRLNSSHLGISYAV